MQTEVRETSGATTCLIVRFVRDRGGEEAVDRLLERAGMTGRLAELEDEKRWFSYEEKIALFEAAAEVVGDPDVALRVGAEALRHRVGAGLRVLLRALGSPRTVLSNVARACPKFSTVASMEVVEMGRRHAVVSYRLHEGKTPHRLDCLLNQGLLSVIGPLFGRPPLRVEHSECQVHGAPCCIYRVSWAGRSWRRAHRSDQHLREQIDALALQVHDMQSTAADLVSADDVATVLARIVGRAGSAIRAARFLLAVRRPGHGLEVHSDGITPAAARVLGAALIDGSGESDDRRIVVEVASADRRYGVIAAFFDEHGFFEQEHDLLAAYARYAAAALDAACTLEESRDRERRNATLLELAQAVSDLSDPDAVAQRLADAIPAVVGGSAAFVMLAEDNGLRTHGASGWGPAEHAIVRELYVDRDADPSIAARFETPSPALVDRNDSSPLVRDLLVALDAEAIAHVPLVRRGVLIGAAAVAFGAGDLPADGTAVLQQLAAVGEFGATALDNAALLSTLQHRALHDELTGLANRARFEDDVEQALARAERDGTPLSILFLDLDRFKHANDTYGHGVGDTVLATVAQRLLAECRSGDVVARIGGDEFAVMLWSSGLDVAKAAAERIRRSVEQPLPLEVDARVSVSIGVATARLGEGFQQLVRRADLAMYEAKRRGRNLCVADEHAGARW